MMASRYRYRGTARVQESGIVQEIAQRLTIRVATAAGGCGMQAGDGQVCALCL
jgi:hypothetical protein